MKLNIKIGLLLLMLCSNKFFAQVGMTTNNSNKNAILDLNNTNGTNTKGLLLPKVTLIGTDTASPLSAHTAGMHVYNTISAGSGATAVTPGEYYNDGSQWVRIANSAWALTGNANTDPSINYIGTADNKDLIIETNNTEQMRVKANTVGNILVGTTTIPTGGTNAELIVNNGTVNGALQIKDGTQASGTVLTSDVNGVGAWKKPVGFGSQVGRWNLTGNNTAVPYPASVTESGTSTISSGDQIGLTALSNGVQVPQGNYMVYITHDIGGNEFGLYQVKTTTGTILFTSYYDLYLGGAAFYLTVPAGGYTIQTTFGSIDCGNSYFWSGTYTQNLVQSMVFLKI